MKRINNLIPKIVDTDNILNAFCNATKGKAGQKEVILFRNNIDAERILIRSEIEQNTLRFGDYHFFTIHDPKERRICAAAFRERVTHHAFMNICGPILDRRLISDSYACRKGKGNKKAVLKAQEYAVKNKYFLKMDIAKYFASIDHTILKNMITIVFKETLLLSHFNKIIDSYETAKNKGLPIGNLTSQYFANFYLSFLDAFIKENLKLTYIRYMDDFIVWHNDRDVLKSVLQKIRYFLDESLNLRLKENVLINTTLNGMNFLGFRVFPNIIRLNKLSKKRFRIKFMNYTDLYKNEIWNEEILSQRQRSLTAFTLTADAAAYRRKIIAKYDCE